VAGKKPGMSAAVCKAAESELLRGSSDLIGIYQIPKASEFCADKQLSETRKLYLYSTLQNLEALGLTVGRENYRLVYITSLSEHLAADIKSNLDSALGKINFIFNLSKPDDYIGRSLNLSDVVVLRCEGEVSAYYLNGTASFVHIPDFMDTDKLVKCAAKHYKKGLADFGVTYPVNTALDLAVSELTLDGLPEKYDGNKGYEELIHNIKIAVEDELVSCAMKHYTKNDVFADYTVHDALFDAAKELNLHNLPVLDNDGDGEYDDLADYLRNRLGIE